MSECAYVYVLSANGRTKIGLADNVEKRVSGIRHAIGCEVTVHGSRAFPSRRSAAAAERLLMRRFADDRLLGEWFTTAPDQCLDALHHMECPAIAEAPQAPSPTPAPSRSDIIYETALAMAEGRATADQVRMSMMLINA